MVARTGSMSMSTTASSRRQASDKPLALAFALLLWSYWSSFDGRRTPEERQFGLARAEGPFRPSAFRRFVEVPVERQQEVAPRAPSVGNRQGISCRRLVNWSGGWRERWSCLIVGLPGSIGPVRSTRCAWSTSGDGSFKDVGLVTTSL